MAKQLHIKLASGVEFVADSINITTVKSGDLYILASGDQVADTYKTSLDCYLEMDGASITLEFKEAVSEEK
jgi:hypothetical protein